MRTIGYGHKHQPKGNINKPVIEAERYETQRLERQAQEELEDIKKLVEYYITGQGCSTDIESVHKSIREIVRFRREAGGGFSVLDEITLKDMALRRAQRKLSQGQQGES